MTYQVGFADRADEPVVFDDGQSSDAVLGQELQDLSAAATVNGLSWAGMPAVMW
ncbi:hypothetical protein [Streptomyces sp. NBC_01264]|uniref:hypothetical protein n=1 Tax=Streptomyces sp. NBC_01264 TaxID=2903804 RepID=UPI00225299FE|nr:hypothetical protein [Streptomyces sp. NBC_01264]MCX4781587.1 hypothetical protein [Streptomyces sp. NBC_01264]